MITAGKQSMQEGGLDVNDMCYNLQTWTRPQATIVLESAL